MFGFISVTKRLYKDKRVSEVGNDSCDDIAKIATVEMKWNGDDELSGIGHASTIS